jgi:hypothetical protein
MQDGSNFGGKCFKDAFSELDFFIKFFKENCGIYLKKGQKLV